MSKGAYCVPTGRAASHLAIGAMLSDSECESDRESPFADCHPASGTDSASGCRKRQLSMPEMARQLQTKKPRRTHPGRRSRSPTDFARGRRPDRSAGESPAALGTAVTLEAIQRLIQVGNQTVIAAFDAKFAQMERRLEIVEAENLEKDVEIRRLSAAINDEKKENAALRDQLESMDHNRRLSSLILTCEDFGPRTQGEDIEARVIQILNDRLPDLRLTTADIQVAHRLQADSKVIVKFIKRRVRDNVYERRFDLFRLRGGPRAPDGGGGGAAAGGRRMAALFINESLTPKRQGIFNALIQAKKPENGGKIISVFTRRGLVYCKTERNGRNIHVQDQEHLRRILGGGAGAPRPGPSPGRLTDAPSGSTGGRTGPAGPSSVPRTELRRDGLPTAPDASALRDPSDSSLRSDGASAGLPGPPERGGRDPAGRVGTVPPTSPGCDPAVGDPAP